MPNRGMIIASLDTAGVEVIDFHWDSAGLPAFAAWMLSACSTEDGREEVEFMFDDSRLIEGANAAWWDFAYTGRLFDEEGCFLVSVGPVDGEPSARPHWARVRLRDAWDVIGKGVDWGVLGGPSGRPGFVMMALDERVIVGATTWNGFISVMRLADPTMAEPIRRAMGLRD
ncbi:MULTISPECIES: hypothetical protein [Micromonospora]|uniref:hypothetical protein n=1 Tax=Micromonospora TaxID=1873 RepID=UPI0023791337|nr:MULTISPECIES: hypothetical protein [Micromonospora]WBB82910.1 hypothetical protein O7542_16115 [Micromonospora sp. WMMC264]WDQ00376.1 hypothetical protein PVK74_00855 [Micromonospora chalcea]